MKPVGLLRKAAAALAAGLLALGIIAGTASVASANSIDFDRTIVSAAEETDGSSTELASSPIATTGSSTELASSPIATTSSSTELAR